MNRGEVAVQNLRFGLAVADAGAADRRWTPLEWYPVELVAQLAPGERVEFRGSVKLEGHGWFRVGLTGVATNAMLRPVGERVHVVVLTTSLTQVATGFALYAVLIGAIVSSVALVSRKMERAPIIAPDWRLAGLGGLLLGAGPPVLWLLWQRLARRSGPGDLDLVLEWLLVGGVLLFAVGWLVVGAGIRPRRSMLLGAFVALMLYVMVGAFWVITIDVSLGGAPLTHVFNPAALAFALMWPLQIAQIVGLVGVSIG